MKNKAAGCGWKIKLPWAYPNRCARDLSILEPGISNFEHAYVRITWDNAFEKRWNLDIPGYPTYPWDQRRGIPTYPFLSLVIPTSTIKGYPGISQNKNLILAYPKTNFLSQVIPGYPGIGHRSGYPGISRYKSGFGTVLFFQMSHSGVESE